jgi:hypothetical protein
MLAATADSSDRDTPGRPGCFKPDVHYRRCAARHGRELSLPVPLITDDHAGLRKDALMTEGHG